MTALFIIQLALLAALFGFRRIMGSDYGLVVKGISDNDRSVMSAGLNIYWYKAQVLFLGASVGCFAGAFGTHMDMFAGMPGFALDYSIMPVAAAVVGGVGTFAGPLIGAFILVPLSEMLRAFGALRMVFYGTVPGGLSWWGCPRGSLLIFSGNISRWKDGWTYHDSFGALAQGIRTYQNLRRSDCPFRIWILTFRKESSWGDRP